VHSGGCVWDDGEDLVRLHTSYHSNGTRSEALPLIQPPSLAHSLRIVQCNIFVTGYSYCGVKFRRLEVSCAMAQDAQPAQWDKKLSCQSRVSEAGFWKVSSTQAAASAVYGTQPTWASPPMGK
jgi:hypothetical protein